MSVEIDINIDLSLCKFPINCFECQRLIDKRNRQDHQLKRTQNDFESAAVTLLFCGV